MWLEISRECEKFPYANFTRADQQKVAQLESDFGVSCALYAAATRAAQCWINRDCDSLIILKTTKQNKHVIY